MKQFLVGRINKFFQWLWIEESPIPYRPQFTIRKVLSPVKFLVDRELGGESVGFKITLFCRSMNLRFLYRWVIKSFHKHYYYSEAWIGSWTGTRILKAPSDLFVYQEIISENKPDVIIECGTASGGSAIFMAQICDIIGNGRIATIDVNPDPHPGIEPGNFRPYHDRILYILGDDTSEQVLTILKENIKPEESVMVILDSNHLKDHVLKQLDLYGVFVTPGQYLIVEDTNLGYWARNKDYKDRGPLFALREWLRYNKEFRIDYEREKHFITFNPCGYLRRENEIVSDNRNG